MKTSPRASADHRNEKDAQDPLSAEVAEGGKLVSDVLQETRQFLLKLVDELPDTLREVLILNSLDELSYEEISRILNIPTGTVGSRIHAARKKLLQKLGQRDLL